jgi:membrane associated rhomboid family serine protease
VTTNTLIGLGKRYPASLSLVISLIATFLFVSASEENGGRILLYFGAMPARLVDAWQALRAGDPTLEPWRAFGTLFSAIYLHADAAHLLQNCLFLWLFAAILEPLVGSVRLVTIFFVAGAAGNVAQTLVSPTSLAPIIGASGGVAGLEGCYLAMALRYPLPWPSVWPIARPIPPHQLVLMCLINFYLDVFSSFSGQAAKPVAYAAHIGGFLTGALVATLFRPRVTAAQ